MSNPLRIGVIGLGRRWRKCYKPALLAMRDRFELRALCDQVQTRAEREASRLGCHAVAGPAVLLERSDVDAVLLVDSQWFQLWPAELACRFGKPVFCACSLESDEAHADSLLQKVRDSKLPVMVAMGPRQAAATVRLREILDTQLGPPRLLLCRCVQPQHGVAEVDSASGPRQACRPGIALLDWCLSFLGGDPASILAFGSNQTGIGGVFLEFGDGRAIQITRQCAPRARRLMSLEVSAERGSATVELPFQVRWNSADGSHAHILRGQRPPGQVLLEQFHAAIVAGQPPKPDLDDAYRVLQWLRLAARSRAEGRRIQP